MPDWRRDDACCSRNSRHSDWEQREKLPSCGLLNFRPMWLQKYARIQMFVLLCCILVTVNQALSSGYFNSVITTIEKRFDIPSRMTGLIASTFEIGNLITVIFVSYFGTHRHIPNWIGKGVLVTGLGSLVFSLAHFMPSGDEMDYYVRVNSSQSGQMLLDDNICHIPQPSIHSPVAERASHFLLPEDADHPHCPDSGSYRSPHLVIFVLAMIMIGCGGTPIFTLGTIYIDDHVRQEDSSMYIGCMYSMVAFGLVVGFLLGGYLITKHENSFGTGNIPVDIYPGHPKWIGAWWCGFVLLGILLILIAIPFFAFPRKLSTRRRRSKRIRHESECKEIDESDRHLVPCSTSRSTQSTLVVDLRTSSPITSCAKTVTTKTTLLLDQQTTEGEDVVFVSKPHVSTQTFETSSSIITCGTAGTDNGEYGRSVKEIPKCMWNLVSNPVYIVTCLGSCMELSIVSGFLVFLPKYLETQFTISKSEANLFAGGIAVPGACIGIFLGGFLLKKFQLGIKGAIQFVLFFNLVCMGLYTGLYFLGCDNMRMAGATLSYYNSTSFDMPFQVNLTAECNNHCRCPPNEIEPICGRNGITYFSPCHAGCKTAGGPRHTQNYSNCACITDPSGREDLPIATAGPCPQKCRAMLPFLVILFFVTLVVSITQMPLLMITLRSVREEERAFALGMQFVIFRLFGYIPSPIVFGNVIDSTCLYWRANCGRQGGSCLIYNIEHFRLRYIGVCSGLKVAAGLLFFLDWVLVYYTDSKKREMFDKPVEVAPVKQIVTSIVSLDRISRCSLPDASGDIINDNRLELLDAGPDSDYNSTIDEDAVTEEGETHGTV